MQRGKTASVEFKLNSVRADNFVARSNDLAVCAVF